MNKKEIRETIRRRKQQFRQDQLTSLSLTAVDRLLTNANVLHARTLLLYYALPDEVDTSLLFERLSDKTILLPKVIDSENMELRIYTGENDLATGCYGIKEPVGKVFTDFAKIDVAIIPGMAFDRHGHRLGRGKGYYDRLLSKIPQAYKIGLCFDFQIVDNVPVDSHDIRMDEVVY